MFSWSSRSPETCFLLAHWRRSNVSLDWPLLDTTSPLFLKDWKWLIYNLVDWELIDGSFLWLTLMGDARPYIADDSLVVGNTKRAAILGRVCLRATERKDKKSKEENKKKWKREFVYSRFSGKEKTIKLAVALRGEACSEKIFYSGTMFELMIQ